MDSTLACRTQRNLCAGSGGVMCRNRRITSRLERDRLSRAQLKTLAACRVAHGILTRCEHWATIITECERSHTRTWTEDTQFNIWLIHSGSLNCQRRQWLNLASRLVCRFRRWLAWRGDRCIG